MDILLISVGYSIVQVCCCSILAYLLVAPVESAADSCKVSAQRPSKPYTSICSPLMALPAAWSDHTAVVEFLLEKGAAVDVRRGWCLHRLRCCGQTPLHSAAWNGSVECGCWRTPRGRSTLPFHAASAEVRPCCILQHGTAAWSAAVGALHAAVPRCRSTLPVLLHSAAWNGRVAASSSLAHSTLPFHTAVPRCRSMLQNAAAAKASVSTCAVDGYGH